MIVRNDKISNTIYIAIHKSQKKLWYLEGKI